MTDGVVETTIDHLGDRFRIVFNEQIANPDGSLTVNGAHMRRRLTGGGAVRFSRVREPRRLLAGFLILEALSLARDAGFAALPPG